MSAPLTRGDGTATAAADPATGARALAFGRVVYATRRGRPSTGRQAGPLSQQSLGDAAGWDRQSVNRVESARFSPSLHRLFLLADALGVRLSDLIRQAEDAAAGTAPAGTTTEDTAHG